MNTVKYLDEVLQYLNNDNENFEDFRNIKAKINIEISNKDLDLILEKLSKDGYINKQESSAANADKLLPPSFYRITYHGRVFLSRGGYRKEAKNLKRDNLWIKTKTIANFLNAALIIIIAALGLYIKSELTQNNNKIENQQSAIYRQNIIIDSLNSIIIQKRDTIKFKRKITEN